MEKVLYPTLDEEATPRQQAYERLDEDLTSLMKDAHIFDEGCLRYVFYTRVVQHVPYNL